MLGVVSVLLVSVWVAAIPATVSVASGSVSVLLVDVTGANRVTVPVPVALPCTARLDN